MPTARPFPSGSSAAGAFLLDPDVVFLNHGSFGALPRAILELQHEWQRRMEREPVRFFVEELEAYLDRSRYALAGFINADAEGLAFVPNATSGVNTVVRSLRFKPGDELLTSNHEYNACNNVLRWAAAQWGTKVVTAGVPFPLDERDGEQQVIDAMLAAVTGRTRLALISLCTSPTGVIFPVRRIVEELHARGVQVLIDAAHGPGMVPLDLNALNAEYVTGNCHKWMCAPKGCAFLHVRRDKLAEIVPLAISHGANSIRPDRSRFRLEFDYVGTSDVSPWLVVPELLKLLPTLCPDEGKSSERRGGWDAVMRRNHATAVRARQGLMQALSTLEEGTHTANPAAPERMLGPMAAVVLPAVPAALTGRPTKYVDALQDALITRHGIQVPVHGFERPNGPPLRLLRVSAQIYNSPEQYEYLGTCLVEELQRERSACVRS